MIESTDNQNICAKNTDRVGEYPSRTYHAPAVPVFLTKKWLAMSRDCYMPTCGKVNYDRLNRLVFSEKVLIEIGMTREELKGVREFDLVTSNKLKKILDL